MQFMRIHCTSELADIHRMAAGFDMARRWPETPPSSGAGLAFSHNKSCFTNRDLTLP